MGEKHLFRNYGLFICLFSLDHISRLFLWISYAWGVGDFFFVRHELCCCFFWFDWLIDAESENIDELIVDITDGVFSACKQYGSCKTLDKLFDFEMIDFCAEQMCYVLDQRTNILSWFLWSFNLDLDKLYESSKFTGIISMWMRPVYLDLCIVRDEIVESWNGTFLEQSNSN